MYLSLYRKWRPRIFDEISGQDHITSILKKQCATDRVSHAYLFCGTRGTGKTSSAKILAKAINCENPSNGNPCNECSACRSIDSGSATDVLEIDAASNNRVDNVRDLREEVVYPPSVLKKRVYIIDEVHMLTDSAFNALLKTLEEPPEYVVFILATTEINELPTTIISRCIRFDFSRINEDAVKQRIEYVAQQENISLADGASDLLATLADGSMRDALSLLEACSNGYSDTLTKEVIRNVLGLAGDETIASLLDAVNRKDIPSAMEIVKLIHSSSKDMSVFIDDLSVAVRDLIVLKQLSKFGKSQSISPALLAISEDIAIELLFYISSVLEETQSRISRYAVNKRIVLEMAIIKMCDRSLADSSKALLARISDLEKKLAVMAVTGSAGTYVAPKVETVPEKVSYENKPAVEQTVSQSKDRQLFGDISEVYAFLSDAPSLNGFLKQSKVFIDDETIVISANDFVIAMIKAEDGERILYEAFSSVIGKSTKIIFEEADGKLQASVQTTLIDEL